MNRNNSDNNTEAVKIANALKPFAKKWFDEWGQSCVRSKKMTVSTPPNGSVIGVKDAFSDTEVFIKYMSSCSNAVVGDTVWCKWMYDNMQTLYADSMGNLDRDNYVPITGGTFTGNVVFSGAIETAYGDLACTGYTIQEIPSYVSIANNAWKTTAEITLSSGVWVLTCFCQFGTNQTGIRQACLSASEDSSTPIRNMSLDIQTAVSGYSTLCRFVDIYTLTEDTTYYLNAWQNSGSSNNTYGRIFATKLS